MGRAGDFAFYFVSIAVGSVGVAVTLMYCVRTGVHRSRVLHISRPDHRLIQTANKRTLVHGQAQTPEADQPRASPVHSVAPPSSHEYKTLNIACGTLMGGIVQQAFYRHAAHGEEIRISLEAGRYES